MLIQQNVYAFDFWAEFKVGFNDTRGNYWLGNDLLHQLTKAGRFKLRCLLDSRENGFIFVAKYRIFVVGSEAENYKLTVGDFSGNAGDSMRYQNGMAFTTYDRDNDRLTRNCAQVDGGGFWHNRCIRAGVNMPIMNGGGGSIFSWLDLPVSNKALNSASMWLTC